MFGGTYRRGRIYVHETPTTTRFLGALTLVAVALFVVAAPVSNFIQERDLGRLLDGFKHVEGSIVSAEQAERRGEIVHLEGMSYKSSVLDDAFGIRVDHALNLERRTEYCMWREIAVRLDAKCEETPASQDNCVSTTSFHYVKSWLPIQLNSLQFNQPAVHYNPLRNPYPSLRITALDTVASHELIEREFYLLPSVLNGARASFRPLEFTLGAQASMRWWTSLLSWLGVKDHTRYESIGMLSETINYPAYRKHSFIHIGHGGYFYSPYRSTLGAGLLKSFFEYLEGSLLEWQWGDLMPSCTAGDIR